MAASIEVIRELALSFPDTSEEPHHTFGSFRVKGKIFVTIPPGGKLLHIFLPPEDRDRALAMAPKYLEPLPWGRQILGVRVHLSRASQAMVLSLVRQAYEFKSGGSSRVDES